MYQIDPHLNSARKRAEQQSGGVRGLNRDFPGERGACSPRFLTRSLFSSIFHRYPKTDLQSVSSSGSIGSFSKIDNVHFDVLAMMRPLSFGSRIARQCISAPGICHTMTPLAHGRKWSLLTRRIPLEQLFLVMAGPEGWLLRLGHAQCDREVLLHLTPDVSRAAESPP